MDHEKRPRVFYADLKYISGQWPTPLLKSGLLRQAENLEEVCPEDCAEGGCSLRPEWAQYPGRDGKVPVVFCFNPDCERRMEVRLEELMSWVVDIREVALKTSTALCALAPPIEVVPHKLYNLGIEPLSRRRVALVRGAFLPSHVDGFDVVVTFGRPWRRDPQLPLETQVVAISDVFTVEAGRWVLRKGVLVDRRAPLAEWLTATAAAGLIRKDLPHLTMSKARARVSAGASRLKFVTNKQSGREMRIEPTSFAAYRLALRDHDLDAEDDYESR